MTKYQYITTITEEDIYEDKIKTSDYKNYKFIDFRPPRKTELYVRKDDYCVDVSILNFPIDAPRFIIVSKNTKPAPSRKKKAQ